MPPILSIILPVYNECPTIAEVVRRVRGIPFPVEIIAVDDGSTDGSLNLLKKLQVDRLISIPANRGKGFAVRAGIPFVTGTYVIFQDGDLEYSPGDLPALLAPLQSAEADLSSGDRWHGGHGTWRWHRFGNKLLTAFFNLVHGASLMDMACCYKMMPSSVLLEMELKSDGFGIDAEIMAKACRRKLRIANVPVFYTTRTIAEGKKIRWWDGLVSVWACVRYRFWK